MAEKQQSKKQIAWTNQLENIGAEHGFYEKLDAEHNALFVRGDDTLVVTFDNLDDARQKVENQLPWGVKFINSQGWSVLGLGAHGFTWYRSEAVFDFFDRLRAGHFFSSFRQVAFYGGSMAAYAATAFSAASPGATVIALAPQATLDRETAGWETRYRRAWYRDFSGRYGYAPDQVRSAKKLWLFYDPLQPADAAHAAMFRGENVSHIRCRHMGHGIASSLNAMGVLKDITRGCIKETVSEADIYRLLRVRRTAPSYQKRMLHLLSLRPRPRLRYHYCHAVLANSYPVARPSFRKIMNAEAEKLKLPFYDPALIKQKQKQ